VTVVVGVMLRGPVSMMLLMMMSPVLYRRQAGVNPVSDGERAERAAHEDQQHDSFHKFLWKTILIELLQA
jgi:hypothetical protein